jgi:drug/metabolite transporter (DMT)-like permease
VSFAALGRRPELTVFVGAVALSFSGVLFRLSHTSPSTGAFFRCVFALLPLWLVARYEERRWGRRTLRQRSYAWIAGLFFAADLIFWHWSIDYVGAGLATVLSNTQVVLVGLCAWLIWRERPQRSTVLAVPVIVGGIVLVSGVLEAGAYGSDPVRGTIYGVLTGLAYTGFLLILREGQRGVVGPAGPLFDATLSSAAACLVAGLAVGDIDLAPSWPAVGWLIVLALSCQCLGWLIVAVSLARLPAIVTSVSLMLQPVCSVLFAGLILGESPSGLQFLGAAAILAGIVVSALGRRGTAAPELEIAG